MAKRGADFQITKDGPGRLDSDSDEPGNGPKLALAEVMAQRKIARPRRRLGGAPTAAPGGAATGAATSAATSADKKNQLYALNSQFIKALTLAHSTDKVLDFSQACSLYLRYFNEKGFLSLFDGSLASSGATASAPASLFAPSAPFSNSAGASASALTKANDDKPNPFASLKKHTDTSASSLPAPAFPSTTTKLSDDKPNPFASLKKHTDSGSATPAVPSLAFSFGATTKPKFDAKPATPTTTATPLFGSSTATAGANALALTPSLAFSFGSAQLAPKPAAQPAQPATKPAAKPAAPALDDVINLDTDSDNDDDDKKDAGKTEVKGPTFTLLKVPTKKRTAFEFGRQPKPKDSDDSESDVELTGPTFQFNAQGAKQTKPVFSLAKTDDKAATKAETKSDDKPADQAPRLFSFGSTTNNNNNNSDAAKPLFSFGNASKDTTKEAAKPLFSFGTASTTTNDKAKDTAKPFTFGSATNDKANDTTKPFTFGSSASTTDKSATTTPLFTFGATNSTTNAKDDGATAPAAPLFSFGTSFQKKDAAEATKPTFSFGSSGNDKPVSAFGTTTTTEKPAETLEKPTLAFSFGKPADTNNNNTNDTTTKPFLFGKPADSNNSASSNSTSTTPAFLFGKPAEQKLGAPAFSFSSAPAFGNNLSSDKPLAFLFSFNKPAKPATGAAAPTSSTTGGGDNNEEKVEDADLTATFTPVVKLSEKVEPITGDENEDVVHTARVKLFELVTDNNNKHYEPKGLGDLKVLKDKDTGKSRVVVRSEGGNRVLLNARIQKSITYSVQLKVMVLVPTVEAKDKVVIYGVRVKTEEMANELLAALNQAKS